MPPPRGDMAAVFSCPVHMTTCPAVTSSSCSELVSPGTVPRGHKVTLSRPPPLPCPNIPPG